MPRKFQVRNINNPQTQSLVHVMDRVQATQTIQGTTEVEIIPGQAGKILYLNTLIIGISVPDGNRDIFLTDGEGGDNIIDFQMGDSNYGRSMPMMYPIYFGEQGWALAEGNGFWGTTSLTTLAAFITVMGHYG